MTNRPLEHSNPYCMSGAFVFHLMDVIPQDGMLFSQALSNATHRFEANTSRKVNNAWRNKTIKRMTEEELIVIDNKIIHRGFMWSEYMAWSIKTPGVGRYIDPCEVPWIKKYMSSHEELAFDVEKTGPRRAALWAAYMKNYLDGEMTVVFRKK